MVGVVTAVFSNGDVVGKPVLSVSCAVLVVNAATCSSGEFVKGEEADVTIPVVTFGELVCGRTVVLSVALLVTIFVLD